MYGSTFVYAQPAMKPPNVANDALMDLDDDVDDDDTTAKISSPGESLTSSQAFMRQVPFS